MIEEALINYGGVGVFCIYLIYDRQVLMKKLTKAIDRLGEAIAFCPTNKKPISL